MKNKIRIGDMVNLKGFSRNTDFIVSKKDKYGKYYLRLLTNSEYGTYFKKDLIKKRFLKGGRE